MFNKCVLDGVTFLAAFQKGHFHCIICRSVLENKFRRDKQEPDTQQMTIHYPLLNLIVYN